MNIDYFLAQLEDTLSLSAFINNEIDENRVNALLTEIEDIENVSEVEFISHEQAFRHFETIFDGSPELLQGLPLTTFPRSFVISMDDVSNYAPVVEALHDMVNNNRGLDNISYAQPIITAISALNTGIRIAAIFMILLLVALANVIIVNTIRLTVNARRNEITIMKYIGATDWFIKWPFIIEGMLIGLIGAALPVLIVWSFYGAAVEAITTSFMMIPDVEFRAANEIFAVLLPLALAIGMSIGTYGSIISMRKHLHV